MKVGLVLLLLSAVSALVGWLALGGDVCTLFAQVERAAATNLTLGLGALFFLFLCLFLTVLPIGTILILLAGYLFGPVAGLVQFAAQFMSSVILYEMGRERDPERLEAELAEWPRLRGFSEFARRRGFTFCVVMRLLPVVPSAVASIAASYFAISRRDFLLGTAAAGWVRPVGFAILGSLGRFAPACGIDPATAWFGE